MQQQILYNSVFSQQILQEYSFNQVEYDLLLSFLLEIHMVVIKSLIKKFDSSQIRKNQDAHFSICSYREFTFNQCPQQIYDQLNQSLFYGDLYFVRSAFKFNLLTPQQQYFIQMNDYISFYARAAFMASQNNGIIQLNYIYNSDTTSLLAGVPSQSFNFTDSSYESCQGSSFIEPYDPRCRSWYQYAQENQGLFIYEPYQDTIVGNLMMTLSSQVNKDNTFYSVQSIDFLLQNLISLFSNNLSLESYPVLIHEFDARVLYHPLQVFYQTISWPDIEFFNINQLCSENKKNMELCLSQKQTFSQQVNQTLEFIKTGNYSILQQNNLGGLYQYWQRFGQKQISLIFPIKSKLRGLNNQYPYSYSIILAVKVIKDNSDQFKMFNLLDLNIIRIPLIIEFVSVSTMIIIFIINYGYFQVFQIQQPIQILIMFLKRSHMQQISSQYQSSTPTKKKKQSKNKFQSSSSATKKKPNQSIFNNQVSKKKIDDKNTQSQLLLNDNQNLQSISNLGLNFTQYLTVDKTLDENLKLTCNPKYQKTNKQNLEDIYTRIDYIENNIQQNHSSKFNFSNSKKQLFNNDHFNQINETKQNQIVGDSYENQSQKFPQTNCSVQIFKNNRLTIQSDYVTQLEREQQKNKGEDQNKILKGLKPLFLEMKIIKKVFQNLESVINFQIDAQNQNSQDTINNLFHFAKAKTTFQNLNNQTGLNRCYFNLGLIYLLKNEYMQASEYFESSIQQGIEAIGIDYENLINQKITKSEESTQNQILILSKRIFSQAYCMKQQALQQIYFDADQNQIENLQNQCEQQSYCQPKLSQQQIIQKILQKSLNLFQTVQKIVQNSFECFSDIFKIFLYQEIAEVLIHLNQNYQIQRYFSKIEKNLKLQNDIPKQIDGTHKKISFCKFVQNSCKSQNQKDYLNEISQIKELQRSRQYFLQGLKEKANQNYITAISNFTRSIEEGTHYNPLLRKQAIYQINELFSNLKLSQINLQQKYLKYEQIISIDFIILLQLEFQLQHSPFESCLEKIKKSNFFRSQDRIKVIIYHTDLQVYIPFTIINGEYVWEMVIDSIKNITKNITQDKNICQKQLSWQQALFFYLSQHQEYNNEDLMHLKQFYSFNKNHTNDQQVQTFQKQKLYHKLEQKKYRKKMILLFSKQQQNKESNLQIKRAIQINLFNKVKPNVYHLKECSNYEKQKFSSKHFNYECFLDENLLITKLTSQRDLQNFNNQNEFLSILNNS
ncbi:hypothetical protein ABPG72_010833 [Tetrahymena utriculariae]